MAKHFADSDGADSQRRGTQAPQSRADFEARPGESPHACGSRAVADASEPAPAGDGLDFVPDPYGWGPGQGGSAQGGSAPSSNLHVAGDPDPYAASGPNPFAAGSSPCASEPNPYASEPNLFAPGSGTGSYADESNPYAAPTSGAVNLRHEQVGPGSEKARRKHRDLPGQGVPGQQRRPRRRKPVLLIVLVAVLALAVGGVYLYLNPPIFSVTVNGTARTVSAGSTLADIVKEGYASPKAGNLMAVDGSVAKEGGGDQLEAQVNDQTTNDASFVVPRGANVTISDGQDTTEDYDEQTETVPHGESGSDVNSFNNYWAGSIHIYSDGEDGEQVTKTGKVSGKTVTEVTKQPVDAGYHVYTADTGDDKVIALTFDDGPWPTTTSEILDILKANDAHATFFEIGNQIAENADVVKRIHEEGHQIGTHTWDHAAGSGRGVDLTRMTADEQVSEVEKGFDAIDQAIGTKTSRILRAPGGNYHGQIITTLRDKVTAEVGWNIDTEDWRKPGADKIEQAILSAKSGDVILMHDGGGDRSETVAALKDALPKLKAEGFKFITVDELLAYGMPKSE